MLDFFPVHYRALIYLSAAIVCGSLYATVFVAKYRMFLKWTVLWLAITGTAFAFASMWLVLALVAFLCAYAIPKSSNERVVYYFALLPVLPMFKYDIPGLFPGMNYFISISYPQALVLFIFLPAVLAHVLNRLSRRGRSQEGHGILTGPIDYLVLIYTLYICALYFRDPSLTSGLRQIFYVIVFNLLVPYYAISRFVKTQEDFRWVFTAILFSAIILAVVGIFEQVFKWLFYLHLLDIIDFLPIRTLKAHRGGFLRIMGTMGPIPLGYFYSLGIGAAAFFWMYRKRSKLSMYATFGLLFAALMFTGSRGAWMAAVALIATFVYRKIQSRRFRGLVLVGFSLTVVLGAYIQSELPGLDELDEHGTFQYRVDLISESLAVVNRNLFFGTDNPNEDDALESMRQGEGIIDIVNTYLQVTFFSGIAGLALFIGIFAIAALRIRRHANRRSTDPQEKLIGNTLFAMLIGTLAMIATVSSISFIPVYYWALIGLSSAYLKLPSVQTAAVKRRKRASDFADPPIIVR